MGTGRCSDAMRPSHISEETRLQALSVPHVTGNMSVQPRSLGRREDLQLFLGTIMRHPTVLSLDPADSGVEPAPLNPLNPPRPG